MRELLELGEKLEGLTRNVGMHAGGVLIAPGKLTDFCPLYAAEGTDNVISQLDKDDVEAIGLVKFDFLGLTTLTVLDWAERYVRGMGEDGLRIETLAARRRGDLRAARVGQHHRGVPVRIARHARPAQARAARPLRGHHRAGRAVPARARWTLIPDFIERKHGQQRVDYLDPRLEPILAPTYGIMVYQEQVMQIAQVIGGYSLGGADLLRRAMGKKKPEEMAKQREHLRRRRREERPADAARRRSSST